MPDVEDLPCQELVELVTAYLDGALDPATQARFEAHLAECEGCTTYLEQFRETIALLGRLEPTDISPRALATMRQAFREWATST